MNADTTNEPPEPRTHPEPSGRAEPVAIPTSVEVRHTVVEGDCLWRIAEDSYGSGTAWTVLLEANRDVIVGDGDLIIIGMELRIPRVDPGPSDSSYRMER